MENPTKILNGHCLYYQNFFSELESNTLYNKLLNTLEWKQEEMLLFGKAIPFPRLTSLYGDKSVAYSYSGKTYNAKFWTEDLIYIKNRLENEVKMSFNSVLVNLYRSGNDSMGWHADNEKELGKNPVIASISFGAKRKFQLKQLETSKIYNLELENGSLLIMGEQVQEHYVHQLPKTKQLLKPRINLTFREIKNS